MGDARHRDDVVGRRRFAVESFQEGVAWRFAGGRQRAPGLVGLRDQPQAFTVGMPLAAPGDAEQRLVGRRGIGEERPIREGGADRSALDPGLKQQLRAVMHGEGPTVRILNQADVAHLELDACCHSAR